MVQQSVGKTGEKRARMRPEPVVAIAGATGLVGKEMLAVLQQRQFPNCEIRLFASADSAGETMEVDGDEVTVQTLEDDSFEGVDIALFATSAELSSRFAPLAVQAGAVAIDNSSYFRMHPEVPLVVPEVNAHALGDKPGIVANPNCSTIQLVVALNPIHKALGLKRVHVATYQSVSGAGKAALDELWNQSLAIFNQTEMPQQAFPHQIAFNCIPHIDTFLDNGFTKEEAKIMNESRKIMGIPDLKISATAVRVPVFHSHAEAVWIETEKSVELPEFYKILEKAPGVELFAANDEYPMQIGAAGGDTTQIGRIRRDPSVENGYCLWVVSDNLRKGAALNAVQIAEYLVNR